MTDELERAGARLRRARASLDSATEAARETALQALAEGHAEAAVARSLGVTRMTIRSWAGKR
ncbi:helix-turn-helix domain-containing protein [Microbacterium rhizomatis]|uniref:Helix-turn-helix domain-containing protein n=1 Tax=Microbacterium rhizomatis TaxID=1631477 RepID=A0A5J5IWX7_9MICO|nr:helix-turn-helix domain-containing protein [Microbacterium rhizomatis]KAA9104995.1 hypothetical protein F6B43_18275 [Microbacterium rhizomatis]